jgi:hypothetical protein
MSVLRRLWESPRLIPVLSVLTVIALVGAAWSVFGVLAQDDARERDRVESDLAGCDRGNRLRLQVIALGEADQEMVAEILDIVLPTGRNVRIDEVRAQLQPVLDEHQAAIDDIELIDCERVTPGTKSTTTTEGT